MGWYQQENGSQPHDSSENSSDGKNNDEDNGEIVLQKSQRISVFSMFYDLCLITTFAMSAANKNVKLHHKQGSTTQTVPVAAGSSGKVAKSRYKTEAHKTSSQNANNLEFLNRYHHPIWPKDVLISLSLFWLIFLCYIHSYDLLALWQKTHFPSARRLTSSAQNMAKYGEYLNLLKEMLSNHGIVYQSAIHLVEDISRQLNVAQAHSIDQTEIYQLFTRLKRTSKGRMKTPLIFATIVFIEAHHDQLKRRYDRSFAQAKSLLTAHSRSPKSESIWENDSDDEREEQAATGVKKEKSLKLPPVTPSPSLVSGRLLRGLKRLEEKDCFGLQVLQNVLKFFPQMGIIQETCTNSTALEIVCSYHFQAPNLDKTFALQQEQFEQHQQKSNNASTKRFRSSEGLEEQTSSSSGEGCLLKRVLDQVDQQDSLFALLLGQTLCLYCPSANFLSDRNGLYPIHSVARRGHSSLLEFLYTAYPFTVTLRDFAGKYALHHLLLNWEKHPERHIINLAKLFPELLLPDSQFLSHEQFKPMSYAYSNCPQSLYFQLQTIISQHVEKIVLLNQQHQKRQQRLLAGDESLEGSPVHRKGRDHKRRRVSYSHDEEEDEEEADEGEEDEEDENLDDEDELPRRAGSGPAAPAATNSGENKSDSLLLLLSAASQHEQSAAQQLATPQLQSTGSAMFGAGGLFPPPPFLAEQSGPSEQSQSQPRPLVPSLNIPAQTTAPSSVELNMNQLLLNYMLAENQKKLLQQTAGQSAMKGTGNDLLTSSLFLNPMLAMNLLGLNPTDLLLSNLLQQQQHQQQQPLAAAAQSSLGNNNNYRSGHQNPLVSLPPFASASSILAGDVPSASSDDSLDLEGQPSSHLHLHQLSHHPQAASFLKKKRKVETLAP